MTSKQLLVLTVLVSLLGAGPTADAQDGTVGSSDFLVWRAAFGVSSVEKLELAIERLERRATPEGFEQTYTLIVTNPVGDIVGLLEIENDPVPETGRSREFGFVTFVAAVDADMLFINGDPVGDVTPNPLTGRYQLGFALVSSHPPGVARGQQTLGAVFASILDSDNNTQAYYAYELRNVQVTAFDVNASGG